jgi:hypothetical protein
MGRKREGKIERWNAQSQFFQQAHGKLRAPKECVKSELLYTTWFV